MSASNNVILSLQNVSKSFDGNHVLEDFDLEIFQGEFVTLPEPSGCGKTTIVRKN